MKVLVILTCLILISRIVKVNTREHSWDHFKRMHNRQYRDAEEEKQRQEIFEENLLSIRKHNKLFKEGKVSFKRSINKLSDISLEEFKQGYNGFRSDLVEKNTVTIAERNSIFRNKKKPPPHIDWRHRGVNTPVKDQEFCQSCWAFAAAAVLEAHELIVHDREVELSEQNLIDCAESTYNVGCLGGHMIRAFNYTRKAQGLSLRMYYPYEKTKRKCRLKDVFNVRTYAATYNRLPKGNETELQRTIAFIGPVAAAIYGDLRSLATYAGGVYYDEHCNDTMINHAVLIVGYGTDHKGQDYWLIKNSLGKYWGEKGYLKLARNRNNHCGIATDAVYPIINTYPLRRYPSSTPAG